MELLNLEEVIIALKNKKIGVILTDTIMGIVALYDNEEGIERISQIKQRKLSKLMPIIVANKKQRDQLVKSEPKVDEFLKKQQKPTTIIYQKKNNVLPNSKIWNQTTMAIRIVKKRWLKKLLEETGPLVATSYNEKRLDKKNINIEQIDTKIKLIGQLDFWLKMEETKLRKQASWIYNWIEQKWTRK